MYCYESILRKCDLQNILDICNKTSKSWHLRNVISGVYTEKKLLTWAMGSNVPIVLHT